jgi:hypothetical protein
VTSPGNGGGVGVVFGGVEGVSGAAGVAAAGVLDAPGQIGKVWSGATQTQAIGSGGADLLDYAPVLGAEVFQKYCFGAGTPLLTPSGSRMIEEFRRGDLVLSRNEWDPSGPVEAKMVEEVFTGTSGVVDLHVGGEVIRTTAEHLFWVRGRGWTAVGDFEPGYELVGHDGQRSRVERITKVDQVVAVYNLRIADHHTYFVGTAEWGWSLWSHNAYTQVMTDAQDTAHNPEHGSQAHVERVANATGLQPEEVEQRLNDVIDNAELHSTHEVGVGTAMLNQMNNGEEPTVQSVFESNSQSGGAPVQGAIDLRTESEPRVFGPGVAETTPAERPKYAYVMMDGAPNPPTPFGPVTFVLNTDSDDLRGRITLTPTDSTLPSANSNQVGTLDSPHNALAQSDTALHAAGLGEAATVPVAENVKQSPTEAQIWGPLPVNAETISRIEIDSSVKDTQGVKDLVEVAERQGIPVVFVD